MLQPKRRSKHIRGTKPGQSSFLKKKLEKEASMKKSKTSQMVKESKTAIIENASKVHGLVYEVVPGLIRFRLWLHKKLLWNFVIRLLIELSLLLGFCCALTVRYAEFTGSFMTVIDVISAYIFIGVLTVLPFFIFFFYLKNFEKMNSEDEEVAEEFEERYGSPLEGLKKENKSSIFHSIWFILRRILFVMIVLHLYKQVLLQLGLQLILSLVSYVYLIQYEPFSEPLIQWLEVFNEVCCILIIDTLYCFTDVIVDPENQQIIGYIFIACLAINIAVHIYCLFRSSFHSF